MVDFISTKTSEKDLYKKPVGLGQNMDKGSWWNRAQKND